MRGYIENPKIISSFQNKNHPYRKIHNRATHGFIFKISGRSRYIFDGREIILSKGEMIFIPQGSSYEYETIGDEGGIYTSINFLADIESPEVSVYPMENFYRLGYINQSFSELWRSGTTSDKYTCMSVFYELLSYISNLESATNSEKKKYEIIEPAIEYMKKHMYDSEFKVDQLHRRCGISDTYFRKIFKSRFGLSPKEYVISERISHARLLIESGDFDSIGEVAGMVGFTDPLYFSKTFRRLLGVCPTGLIG